MESLDGDVGKRFREQVCGMLIFILAFLIIADGSSD
jgi:hypothetical protein